MTWMLTGGAGYIGAHIVRAFQTADLPVVVLDDLSTGIRENVPDDVPFVQASVADADAVRAALREHGVTGVLHLAAKKAVGESVEQPLLYWDENVGGMRSLLQSCLDEGVDRVLFSSSAAVFGEPPVELVTEETADRPDQPVRRDEAGRRVDAARPGHCRAAALGRAALLQRRRRPARPSWPTAASTTWCRWSIQALSEGRNPQLFGDDYPTRDGSCIRDYIHVVDLAEAHAAAARRLDDGPLGEVYNVGRGEGISVKEVLDTVREVTGIDFTVDVVGRRPGDAPVYFADATKIGKELGWTARLDLSDMVRSAWEAWQSA